MLIIKLEIITILSYVSLSAYMSLRPYSTLFPYTTLFRSPPPSPCHPSPCRRHPPSRRSGRGPRTRGWSRGGGGCRRQDRKSTRLNSSHSSISYAVFCLKKKTYNT